MYTEFINAITKDLQREEEKARSAWKKGVVDYAFELVDSLSEGLESGYIPVHALHSDNAIEKALLNGAYSWKNYSYGACSLVYNFDIANRLCTKTELKRASYGDKDPNRSETWLDVQARALYQACELVKKAIRNNIVSNC